LLEVIGALKGSIEFLVVDDELEAALRDAIGPRRRFFVERGTRRWPEPREGSRRMVVTWARHLSSCQPPGRAGQGAGTEYLVLVGPETPVEALSEVGRLSAADLSRLLFVGVEDLVEMRSYLRALVQRLSLAEESERILHAWWMNGNVQILTTSFRRIDALRRSIPSLRGVHSTTCGELEVVPCGTGMEPGQLQ
jgi:hypothetical protein